MVLSVVPRIFAASSMNGSALLFEAALEDASLLLVLSLALSELESDARLVLSKYICTKFPVSDVLEPIIAMIYTPSVRSLNPVYVSPSM